MSPLALGFGLGLAVSAGAQDGPTSIEEEESPALLVVWYSQHGREDEMNYTNKTSPMYSGRVVVTKE